MLRIADNKNTVILYDSIFEPASVTKFNRSKNKDIFTTRVTLVVFLNFNEVF